MSVSLSLMENSAQYGQLPVMNMIGMGIVSGWSAQKDMRDAGSMTSWIRWSARRKKISRADSTGNMRMCMNAII